MRQLLFFLVMLCLAGTARAGTEPIMAPAGDWVTRTEIPAPNPALNQLPVQALLVATQSRYATDEVEHYAEMALLAQTSQGVQALGNVTLPWQPDRSDLIIHKAELIRGDQVIDLLADGRRFTVLRRENNLEGAMLDGVLTAVMQAEGMVVGDILHVAYSFRQRPGALPLRGENLFTLGSGAMVRRLYARQIWTDDVPIRWRASGLMSGARARRTRQGTELIVDLADAVGPQPPAAAPPRFAAPFLLQLTQYRDWAELSADLAPHYARAATLAPDSPLRARVDEIAATSADPAVRAMAALRLVQDEVRYFAVTLGDGNFLPASADETWTRRYGDCKGKTVLLIALLNALGIEAEPVLVNVNLGDALGDSLPQIGLFNHVLVRIRVDGRSYWLDGTRAGDRRLAALASSRFGWGLPLRDPGAELERMPFLPADVPVFERRITYDASRGLLGAVPVSGDIIFRGETAAMFRQAQGPQADEGLLGLARAALDVGDEVTPEISHDYDEATATYTLHFSATREMDWSGFSARRGIAYQFDEDTIAWNPPLTRTGDAAPETPFAVPTGDYIASTETLILPRGGEGFTLIGENLDRTVAGVRLRRELALEDGRATVRLARQPLQTEISVADARAAEDVLETLRDDHSGVRAPAAFLTDADRQALRDREPTTADEFLNRGYTYLQAGNLDGASADFRRAAELAPELSRPLSNQALVQIYLGHNDEAESLLTRAEAIDTNDFVIHQARGILHLARNRPVQAVAAFTRALAANPDNPFTLLQRAGAYQQLGEFDGALADFDTILARDPANVAALAAKARVYVWRQEAEPAIAAANALVATDPQNPALLLNRAEAYSLLGRTDEASRDYAAALALVDARQPEPNTRFATAMLRKEILDDAGRTGEAVQIIDGLLADQPEDGMLYNERCWLRATRDMELSAALADCERAIELEPRNAAAIDSRAFVRLKMGQYDRAIADATAAIALSPQMAASFYVRGVARLRQGDRSGGDQDLAMARRLVFDIDSRYRRFGVTPEGTPSVAQPAAAPEAAAGGE